MICLHVISKDFFIYWSIECILKLQFIQLFHIIKIIYIYWPIECVWKLQFIRLLTIERIDFIYWTIDDIKKLQFFKLLAIAIVAYIYWPNDSLENFNLSYCQQNCGPSLTKWCQYFDLFTCFQMFQLPRVANIYWPFELALAHFNLWRHFGF